MEDSGGLVVLSGCHSDAGRVLPGAGLLGLTRAWLTAGAHVWQAAVGTRPTRAALCSPLYIENYDCSQRPTRRWRWLQPSEK